MNINEFFNEHKKVALAFSGGADSAYLLYAAVNAARTLLRTLSNLSSSRSLSAMTPTVWQSNWALSCTR